MEKSLNKSFGLSISNTAITAVEVDRGKFGLKVVNYSRIELEPGIIEDGCIILNEQAFEDALSKLILDANNGPIKTKNVVISLPEEKTFSHKLNIPKEYYNDDEYIQNKAKDFIPITLDEAVVDYQIIKDKSTDKNLKYIFVSTQKSIVNPLIKILKKVNLNVVGIDTNKNSLIRSCNNEYQKNEDDFMVMHINSEKTTIDINIISGMSYHTFIDIGGKKFNQLIKETLKLPNITSAQEIVEKYKNDTNSIPEDQKTAIRETLQGLYNSIIIKANELIRIIRDQENLNLKTIYLIGSTSVPPGLIETIQTNYPKIEIKQKLEYIEIGGQTEVYYAHAIGLALKDAIHLSREDDINLLPQNKREEIEIAKATPKIKTTLIGISLLFGMLMVLFGTIAVKNYINYQFSDRKLSLLDEQAMNPYLNEIAKANQEKTQLKNAIYNVLENAIPASQIMKSIDSYNSEEVGMINADLRIGTNNDIEMSLRAKTSSRDSTEYFILDLEQNPYFSEVDSPLSNLVGKGERFVNINLILDPDIIIGSYEEERMEKEKAVTEELESSKESGDEEKKPKVPTDNNTELPEESEQAGTNIQNEDNSETINEE